MELQKEEFIFLRKYIHDAWGILVDENKEYLIRQRLEPIVDNHKLGGFPELCKALRLNPREYHEEIIIAISTNETFFFRDERPFKAFRNNILPQLAKLIKERNAKSIIRKGAKVRIWCVASSTGQEPYSIAMLIHEYCELMKSDLKFDDFSILATDINSEVLAKAVQGKYNQFEIQRGLDSVRMNKYFRKQNNDWIISSELQTIIEFKKLNLATSFLFLGGFDVIFCRNVLIYFDDKTKSRILNEISQLLSQEGSLILGASENIYGLCDKFNSINVENSIVFKKN